MKHPTHEQWMSYLYDEVPAGERTALTDHLTDCPECMRNIAGWQTAQARLALWELPERRAPVRVRRPALRWAAAAAVLLGLGIGIGRMSSNAAEAAKVRASIEPEIHRQLDAARREWRQELTQSLRDELDKTAAATLAASGEQTGRLLADYATALETRRLQDSQAVYSALAKLDSRRAADYLDLKKDLDTVAVNTDAGLRNTEQQLIQLADYAQPANVSPIVHK